MLSFNILTLLLTTSLYTVSAQSSIDAHEGFNVPMQAGISLAICFTILTTITITINLIKKKYVKVIP